MIGPKHLEIEDAKTLAIDPCVAASGNKKTTEVVEIYTVTVSYITIGATRILVEAAGGLVEGWEEVTQFAKARQRNI
jgi:hypothetical protein